MSAPVMTPGPPRATAAARPPRSGRPAGTTASPVAGVVPARTVFGGARPWPVLIELSLTLVACAVGLATFGRFFGGWSWTLPVTAALLVGTGVAVLFQWRRWPDWALLPASVLVLLVFQIYALHAATTTSGVPGRDTLTALVDGVASGWARMLSVALPADPSGELLSLPTLLAFGAGVVTALLVCRTRAVIALTAAPIGLFVTGLLFTAGRPGYGTVLTALLLAVLGVLLLIRTNRQSAADDGLVQAAADTVGLDLAAQRRHSAAGRVLIGLPVLAVVIALAVVGGRWLPIADGDHRADPRVLVTPEVVLTAGLSPLVEVKPQLAQTTPTELYRVRVRAPEDVPVRYIRIAALDAFDGALWTQSGRFVAAGSVLPETPSPPGAQDVTLDVEVLTSRTPYLPVVGVPERTSGVAAGIESTSGTLISLAAARGEGIQGLRYEVQAAAAPLAGVDQAVIGAAAASLVETPGLPTDLQDFARGATAAWTTSWDKLKALEKNLYERRYSLDARPGESYGAIMRVLFDNRGNDIGYAEQYASAFAVAARALGYPARIAVGYGLDDATKVGDTYTVTTADAQAWPEVLIEGYGWVRFNPTNVNSDSGPPPPVSEDVPQLPDTPTPPTTATPATGPDVPAGREVSAGVVPQAVLVGLWIAVGIVLVLALVVGAIVSAKLLRRARRRSSGSPARQIAAAWQEVLDRLRETGHPAAASQTPNELAAAVATQPAAGGGGRAAATALTELALSVSAAVCAPGAPTPVAAKRAWTIHDTVVHALGASRPLLRRALAWVDPRPLLPGSSRLIDDEVPAGGAPSGGRAERTDGDAPPPEPVGVGALTGPAAAPAPAAGSSGAAGSSAADRHLAEPVVVTLPVVAAQVVAREAPPSPVLPTTTTAIPVVQEPLSRGTRR